MVGQSQAAMERLRAAVYRAAMYPTAGAGADGMCDDDDDIGREAVVEAAASSHASSSGRGAADPKTARRGIFRFGRRFKERSVATAPRLQ